MSTALAVSMVLSALLGLLLSVRLVQARAALHPELARKFMHVGVGLIALSFPLLFTQPGPVWLVCGVAALTMLLLRSVRALRQTVGATLHEVDRASLGDVYFLGGVAVLFSVAPQPVFYVIPLLVLTFADALAALAGVAYGRLRYAGEGVSKSVEGSVAFFLVAFLSAHVPLLLFTDVGRAQSLLIALLVAFVVMLIEALSWDGIDNLFIPVGCFIVLRGNHDQTVVNLLWQIAGAAVAVGVFAALRGRMGLRGSVVIAAGFVAFVCWSIGGPAWTWAPVTLLLGLAVSWSRRGALGADAGIPDLLGWLAPALVWLLLGVYRQLPQLLFPFTVACAALLTLLWCGSLAQGARSRPLWTAGAALTVAAAFLAPFALGGAEAVRLAVAALPVLLVLGGLAAWLGERGRLSLANQSHLAAVASLSAFGVQLGIT